MYNQTYISDFAEEDYNRYLNNTNDLNTLAIEYLKQYKDNSNAVMLAFKESLDYYIVKRIAEDDNYINSREFRNYWNYLMQIVERKKTVLSNTSYNMELSSNIIFRNENIRNKIFKRFYAESIINQFENHINRTKEQLNSILNKMLNRSKITQDEIDFVSDYIYSSRNFDNGIGEVFAEYLFNEITPESNIKVSVEILGAITSYFTQEYTKDKDVKNSRMFITDYDNKSNDLAHKSGNRKYCYFNRKYFSGISLVSDNSLNKSRTYTDKDLYFLMMVSFHELTHEHQENEKNRNSNSSSAMSYIIKDVLNKNLTGFIKLDKDGNPMNISEYNANHDATEYEIQADEESWRQSRAFIAKHCRQYAYKHHLDSKIAFLREDKCFKNEQEIRTRRAFSLKEDKTGNKLYYALYDIKNLVHIAKSNPNIISKYPVLRTYIDSNGNLDTSILFSDNITSTDNVGLDIDNSGLEFATYMIDFGKNKVMEKISSGNLTELQIRNLILNIYNVLHQNVLKVRDFDKAKKTNYDKTNHNYDLENKSNAVYNYYFKKNADEVYIAIEILYKIHEFYPQIDVTQYNDIKYYQSYFYELLSKTKDIDLRIIKNICNKYDSSHAPALLELSNFMKENILLVDFQNQDSIHQAVNPDGSFKI